MKTCTTLIAVATLSLAQTAFAHAYLDHASPKVGEKLATAPTAVEIWFTDDLAPKGTDIQVFDANNTEVDSKDSRIDPRQASLLRVSLPALSPGVYKVVWHATCPNGHHTTSSFRFTVAGAK